MNHTGVQLSMCQQCVCEHPCRTRLWRMGTCMGCTVCQQSASTRLVTPARYGLRQPLPDNHVAKSSAFSLNCLNWLPKLCKVLASHAVTAAAALTRIAQQSPSVRQERVDDVVVLFCNPVDPFRSAVPHTHTHNTCTLVGQGAATVIWCSLGVFTGSVLLST